MRRVLIPLVSAFFLPLSGCDAINGLFNSEPQITLDPGPVCPATGEGEVAKIVILPSG